MPQNKFEVLKSRVMQCGVEGKMIRSIRVVVECFKCGEEGHKCRECPQWERKKKRVARPREGKALMGIKRFDHETKVKARSESLQTASQLCTKQVGTGEINQIIESLLKVKVQRITKTY